MAAAHSLQPALITLAPVVGFDGTEDVLIDFKLIVFVVVVLVVVLILLVTNVLLLVVDATELVAIMGAVLAAIVVPTLADSPVSSGVVETTIAVDVIESDSLVDLIDFAGDVEFSDGSDTGVVSIGVTICWGISGRELLFAAAGVPVAIEETNVVVVKLEGVLGALKLAVRATVVGVLGALDTALTCSAATLLGVLGKDAEAFVWTPKMRDVSEYCHFVPLPSELLVSSAKAQQRPVNAQQRRLVVAVVVAGRLQLPSPQPLADAGAVALVLQTGNHVAIDAIAEVAVIVREIFAVAPLRVPLVALDSVLSPGSTPRSQQNITGLPRFGHENILRVNINVIINKWKLNRFRLLSEVTCNVRPRIVVLKLQPELNNG
uniref:Uncharacterized protein n=1 Tax=Glossina austeni TaxID=7395 RepID=A0A1A9VEL6_GLOAU